MKRLVIPIITFIITVILLGSCEGYIPRAYAKVVDIYLKYDNIESIEGEKIVIQRIATRENENSEVIYIPGSVMQEWTLTPSINTIPLGFGPSDGNDKNYIDVVGIRRDSIHNWLVEYEERGRDKIPVLVSMSFYFNGVKYTTNNDTITIDLAGRKRQ